MDADTPDLAGMYRETRERLAGLVAGLDEAQLGTPVPACPGWSVADVVGHLAAIPEDALAG
ncbi:MAG TPA: maleylpyruvate isomerase N-terminal domain-containing protein [Streptosporangiaceae bacterium]|nr:maleylpyruvate isomerase N-terminal domain-containing protein [Streptosporangiaceae bacterium]